MTTWEDELREFFPAYLLPSSEVEELSREVAELFLARLGCDANSLPLLLAASALAPVVADMIAFARELPSVAATLQSRTHVRRVESVGELRGKLDAPATARARLGAGAVRFATKSKYRDFNLPENALLAFTADRLASLATMLLDKGAAKPSGGAGWSVGLTQAAASLRHTLATTPLREVAKDPIGPAHKQAARAATHPLFQRALRLYEAIERAGSSDAKDIAQALAEGALLPLQPETRFELAVMIRLARAIERALEGKGFTLTRAIVEKSRSHVFEFASSARCIRIHYNKQRFDQTGDRDRGMRHYFGNRGTLRPDITLEHLENGKQTCAFIIEAKLSSNTEYLKTGYEQALLYRHEYRASLTGWPKVLLVASADDIIVGKPRREDDVIAMPWQDWVAGDVIAGLVAGAIAPTSA